MTLMILVQTKNAPGAKNEGDVAPEALPRRSKAVVSPHILLTNNPADPSPCHHPDAPNPLSFTPPFPWCQAASFHRRRHRWLSFSTPACPEVDLVLLRVADYWGGAARKASAPGPTDPLPPSLPCLGKGGSWQTLHSTFAQSIHSKYCQSARRHTSRR